jgi:hypothetical protein
LDVKGIIDEKVTLFSKAPLLKAEKSYGILESSSIIKLRK